MRAIKWPTVHVVHRGVGKLRHRNRQYLARAALPDPPRAEASATRNPPDKFDAAADGLTHFATCHNYDRLHGERDWHTPAERYDGTPFTARGLERVPSLDHLQGWLVDLMTV